MLTTALAIPPALPGQAWSVVLGPLAGLAAFAVFAVFVFLVVGAIVELGNAHAGTGTEPPQALEPARGDWPHDERLVA